MQTRLRVAAAASAAALAVSAVGLLAPPAHAAAGDTITTFSITGGTLSMSVPSSTVNLGSTAAGSLSVSGQLGDTSVTDNRGNLVATWTNSVTATNFVTGTATTNETVANTNVTYSSGAATSSTGTGAFTPGVHALGAVGTGGSWLGVGVNSAHWNPTLSFVLSASQVAGLYTGTINQSVA